MRPGVAAVLLLLLAGCASAPSASPTGSAGPSLPRGGILRVGVPGDFPPSSLLAKSVADDGGDPRAALDPQAGVFYDSLELLRCCLGRTLLSYFGRPTDEGGTVLRPDLAESLPEVSSDGLTWTFKLRQGVHYAPPLQATEVTSADFVRSLQRLLRNSSPAYRPGIAGVEEYLDGRASTVSGLEAVDRYTLRVRLSRPEGDLPARLAYPDTAPIPPSPTDPQAAFGVATGHDADYGAFLVSSGPYMVEGADAIDFSLSVEQQVPAAGFQPGQSLILVRNPSWKADQDELRPAYVDRIELSIGGSQEELAARVDSGELDFVLFAGPPPHAPIEQIDRYRANPGLGSVHSGPRDFVRNVGLNLAYAPFDDLHVRKAVSLVIDKAGMIELGGGPWTGQVAGHIVINSLVDNLLLTYDPYSTAGSHGDIEAAKAEMRLSRYDTDGDGLCDDDACTSVTAVTMTIYSERADVVVANLAELGIQVDLEVLAPLLAFGQWFDPLSHTGMMVGTGFGKDHLNAASFFTANFDGRTSITSEEANGTLLGASPEQLASWGYGDVEVPNIDERIDDCHVRTGSEQVQCWAALDQYVMENVVPWVPYVFERHTRTVGPRVVNYSFDQLLALPALDQIAVAPASASPSYLELFSRRASAP